MIAIVKNFLREDSGATMVEYGIMVAMIAAVCVAVIYLVGQYVDGSFVSAGTGIKASGVTPSSATTF